MDDKIEKWKFAIDNDKLVKLVLSGEKKATTSLYSEYIVKDEKLPKIGDRSIILYSDDKYACLIENIDVIISEFKNITSQIAYLEGEGNKSIDYYKKEHYKVFKKLDSNFNENSKVVVEIFKIIEIF